MVPTSASHLLDFLSKRSHRIVIFCGAMILLAIYFFYTAAKFRLHELTSFSGDATIIYTASSLIAATGQYPAHFELGNFNEIFPYPPPAVLLFSTLGNLPKTAFILLWEALTFVALCASVRLSVDGETEELIRAWPLLLAPVILLVFNPIEYDLRNKNINLMLLALTLFSCSRLRKWPLTSGIILAVVASTKLYSGLLLPWMIVFHRRAAIGAMACLAALWLIMPPLYWGISGTIDVYRGWFEQVAMTNGAWVYTLLRTGVGPPLVTLRSAAAQITGADPYANSSKAVLMLLQLCWLGIVAWYGYRLWRQPASSWRETLMDWSILLLVPLPFSPWLEPYHAVVLVPGCTLCVVMASDPLELPAVRSLAAMAGVAILVAGFLPAVIGSRGLAFLIQFAVLTLAFGLIRPSLRSSQAEHSANAV